MLKTITVIVIGLCLSIPCAAGLQQDYEAERERILALDISQRHQAVSTGGHFDTATPLGKHFYNTVIRQTAGGLTPLTLSPQDELALRERFPKYYLEHEILQQRASGKALAEIEASLTALAAQAKQQQWLRLYRLAMAEKVAVLQARGLTYQIILAIRNVLTTTEAVPPTGEYDYSLAAIYTDLARAYLLSGSNEKALFYCQKLRHVTALNDLPDVNGRLCQAAVLLAKGAEKEALKLSDEVLEYGKQATDASVMASASYGIAKIYYVMGNISLAQRFAREGVEFTHKFAILPNGIRFKLYGLLTQIALKQGNLAAASLLIEKMHADNRPQASYMQLGLVRLEAEVAQAKGQHARAAHLYQQLSTTLLQRSQSALDGVEVADLDDLLQETEAALIKTKTRQEESRSRNMTVLALFTTTISIVCAIAVFRLYKHKTLLESFTRLDQLTSVDNRWYAMKAVKRCLVHMERAGDQACLALLDIDHFKRINEQFGYDTGDSVLAHVAKVLKYQLRREDVIGRYDGEKFILLLMGTGQTDGLRKIDDLRQALAVQDLPEIAGEGPLRFSCGLVEVSGSAVPEEVIALCDTLLQSAKMRGRNQTCSSPFLTPQKARCS